MNEEDQAYFDRMDPPSKRLMLIERFREQMQLAMSWLPTYEEIQRDWEMMGYYNPPGYGNLDQWRLYRDTRVYDGTEACFYLLEIRTGRIASCIAIRPYEFEAVAMLLRMHIPHMIEEIDGVISPGGFADGTVTLDIPASTALNPDLAIFSKIAQQEKIKNE